MLPLFIRVVDLKKMIELSSTKSINTIHYYNWGLLPYESADRIQQEAWKWVQAEESIGIILGGEITPVITQGIRAQDQDILSADGFDLYHIKRGGETTLHSPGQLVIYPVLNLKKMNIGVRSFVQMLLRISQKTFEHFDVSTQVSENPVGLFTSQGKIGFCGLQIKQSICQHGLSLNIQNNLDYFQNIISCGIQRAAFDKLENYNSNIQASDFFKIWIEKAFLEDSLQKNQSQEKDWRSRDVSS